MNAKPILKYLHKTDIHISFYLGVFSIRLAKCRQSGEMIRLRYFDDILLPLAA